MIDPDRKDANDRARAHFDPTMVQLFFCEALPAGLIGFRMSIQASWGPKVEEA